MKARARRSPPRLSARVRIGVILVGSFVGVAWPAAADDDILIADFESATYDPWRATGAALGSSPAEGTLPGQMPVSGFAGKRLVNTFHGGDGSVGTLVSPPLRVERDYITFLVGGGGHEGKTCVNLLLDEHVVRTTTGPNTQPGGSEELEPAFWDVREFRGKSVTIAIVDEATGGWGHVNADQFSQTNTRPNLPDRQRREREFTVNHGYLVIPIKNGAKNSKVEVHVDGKAVRRYGAELALTPDSIDWHAYLTLEPHVGKTAKLIVDPATREAFDLIRQTDTIPGAESFYAEPLRPQFHFSQTVGWNNDPNGMVFLDGEWHLYFQHNPVGWNWGNMTWGHAVSKDLIHWEQLPDALYPGTMARGDCFSGSATVDTQNTAGWKTGDHDVLVAFLTDTGAGESVAFSNDRGRSFTWYEGNPVVKHNGRDPKVIWYAYDKADQPLNDRAKTLGGHWVMAVYDEHPQFDRNVAFHVSTDLKEWQERSHLPGYFECPELFELSVDGGTDSRWVVFAADAQYAVGQFDGVKFTPEHEGKHQVHHGAYYASQTFDHSPDGRRIQIGWARINMPGMPFNQTFSFPHELALHSTAEGIRMRANPIREIEALHKKRHGMKSQLLTGASPATLDVAGELFDIRVVFELGTAQRVGLDIGGNIIAYDVAERKLNGAPLQATAGRVTMRVLVDRPMLEICGNEGVVVITAPRDHKGEVAKLRAFADGGDAKLVQLDAYELNSIWKK